ncbi:hypothetical protein PENSPDRAFT_695312 [Peniophora sp. CONT]|nr:hypothetical protein PENSPDRAFT_695312 [Peniophora sp. CONT]
MLRALEGLPLRSYSPSADPAVEEEAHFRVFIAANALYAWLDYDPARWTDYTSDTESQLALTDSGRSTGSSLSSNARGSRLPVEQSHIPGFLRRTILPRRLDLDAELPSLHSYLLPNLTALCLRPSDALWEDGVWHCPLETCNACIDPLDLAPSHQQFILSLAGGSAMLVQERSNYAVTTSLSRTNPWRFLRHVDALGWEHLKVTHLNPVHIELWYPDPSSPYRHAPGFWWMPTWLADATGSDVRMAVEQADTQFKTRLRIWKARKALAWAKQGLHRARVHLTQLRHGAMQAREDLVQDMITAGRGVVDISLAVLARVRAEEGDEERAYWVGQRNYYQEIRREWLVQRREWMGAI